MTPETALAQISHLRKRWPAESGAAADPREERTTMAVPEPCSRPRKQLDAGVFQPEIGSFRLHLAAEGKAAKTIRNYVEAVQWFAAAHLRRRDLADQVGAGGRAGHRTVDGAPAGPVQPGLRQQPVPRPAAVLQVAGRRGRAPRPDGPAPPAEGHRHARPGVHQRRTAGPGEGLRGPGFAQRRDAAIIAVFRATGVRLAELAAIRYDPHDTQRSDVDLWQREITVRGKGGKPRIVRIGHQAALTLDRYLRIRARHAQAWRPQLWLGTNNRGPLTPSGIYQIITRRGRQAGVVVYPHRFRHHFSHTWLDRGGAGRRPDGAERLVLPADAAPLRRQCPQRPGPPHLRPRHGRPALTIASTRKVQATQPDELHARPTTVQGGSA